MFSQKITVDCPICGSKKYKVRFRPTKEVDDPLQVFGAASGVRGTQRIVKCQNCSMQFENPRFSEEIILRGYGSSAESRHDSQFNMRVNSFFRTLLWHSKLIPPKGAKILDVGCAGGAFLKAAIEFGYDARGLEPSKYLVDSALKRGLKVDLATLFSAGIEQKSFDMICLLDVIEHMAEPKKALEKVYSLLKNRGTLFISYPDVGTIQAKLAGSRFWWLHSGHLHYFTRTTMRKLLEASNFKVSGFFRYWQTLQFGYLEDIAIHLKIPGSMFLKSITPKIVQDLPLSYYAGQTLVIARAKE